MSTPASVSDVTAQTFDQDVIVRSSTVPVLVDFWAAWCGPCRALGPQIEAAVSERSDVVLAKVDTETNQDLAKRFSITGIPHVKLFKDGREVAHFVGARGSGAITAFLDENLGPSEFEKLLEEHRAAQRFDEVIAALELGYVEQAFSNLIGHIERGEDLETAKKFLVAAFSHFSEQQAVVSRYRKQLATMIL